MLRPDGSWERDFTSVKQVNNEMQMDVNDMQGGK